PMTSLKTSIKTITYLSDTGCLEIQGASLGWKNVSVYDGGWYEWSSDPKNPVATGERGPDSSK
ncbi:hypothetical protein, partial [Shigella sonnei]|uniref:hypothetical protein n=2 Tax=Shigella sonnei TaxID=624 RepID=UPI0008081DBC